MAKIEIYLFIVFLSLASCASAPNAQDHHFSFDRLSMLEVGEPGGIAIEKLGKPESRAFQTIGGGKYEDLSFYKNGRPLGFVFLDSISNRIAAKATYLIDGQKEEDFLELQKSFPDAKFVDLKTCDKHFGSIYKVDESKGLFIGISHIGRDTVDTVMWTDPKLTKDLITELREKCSK